MAMEIAGVCSDGFYDIKDCSRSWDDGFSPGRDISIADERAFSMYGGTSTLGTSDSVALRYILF